MTCKVSSNVTRDAFCCDRVYTADEMRSAPAGNYIVLHEKHAAFMLRVERPKSLRYGMRDFTFRYIAPL